MLKGMFLPILKLLRRATCNPVEAAKLCWIICEGREQGRGDGSGVVEACQMAVGMRGMDMAAWLQGTVARWQ
eukprot:359240-Chlamydomonas_euryale.AAC.18